MIIYNKTNKTIATGLDRRKCRISSILLKGLSEYLLVGTGIGYELAKKVNEDDNNLSLIICVLFLIDAIRVFCQTYLFKAV